MFFVLSEEKYADLKLINYLSNFAKEHDCIVVIVNKSSHEDSIVHDVHSLLSVHNIRDRVKGIVVTSFSEYACSRDFKKVTEKILELDDNCLASDNRLRKKIQLLNSELETIIDSEHRELTNLKDRIVELENQVFGRAIESHSEEMLERMRLIVQSKIKEMYSKYDIFSGPRRFIKSIISFPFRIFQSDEPRKASKDREDFDDEILSYVDFSVVAEAVYTFVRNVFDTLEDYPHNSIVSELKKDEIVLTESEISELVTKGLKDLFSWLKKEFDRLQEGIPKLKELGIYSTMVLWAIFILSIEAAVGGGISLFDAALDSVLTPFISKGAVELFARQDVHRIGRELIKRYRELLKSITTLQRDRFLKVIKNYEKTLDKLRQPIELCKNEQF